MALSSRSALRQLAATSLKTRPTVIAQRTPRILTQQCRNVTMIRNKAGKKVAKQKKRPPEFPPRDLREATQFSLCDAIRYIRAFEVGRTPTSSKYDLAVRLRTMRTSQVVRNRLRLPHPVDTSIRIAVICPADSKHAKAARAAGAAVVGEEDVFAAVRDGKINFDRCICHVESLPTLLKANVARVLGPRGLMPNAKHGTVVKDVGRTVSDMFGGSEYREREGVVRMAIGQLAFTPEMVQANIRAFMTSLNADVTRLRLDTLKEIAEVVLSSTNAPGFSLDGSFTSPDSVPTSALSTA